MKPWLNEQLRWEYFNRYPFDECYRYICEVCPEKKMLQFYSPWFGRNLPEKYRLVDGSAVHHLHQAKSGVGKWDLWSNLITVSKPTHDWLHAYPIEGRVVCLYAKWQKARHGNEEDFQVNELSQASGKTYPSVIGTYDVAGRFREMRDELVCHFAEMEAA